VVGIYGVISYIVAQRTREIGIRMALGAQQRDVSGMFVRHGLVLTVTGWGVAVGLTRLLSTVLFGFRPLDPVTFGAVTVALGIVATLASYLPARRASRVDPAEALRWKSSTRTEGTCHCPW
jgi:putative ABC transport system permease protein